MGRLTSHRTRSRPRRSEGAGPGSWPQQAREALSVAWRKGAGAAAETDKRRRPLFAWRSLAPTQLVVAETGSATRGTCEGGEGGDVWRPAPRTISRKARFLRRSLNGAGRAPDNDVSGRRPTSPPSPRKGSLRRQPPRPRRGLGRSGAEIEPGARRRRASVHPPEAITFPTDLTEEVYDPLATHSGQAQPLSRARCQGDRSDRRRPDPEQFEQACTTLPGLDLHRLVLMGAQILGRLEPPDGAVVDLKPWPAFPEPEDPPQTKRRLAVGHSDAPPIFTEGISEMRRAAGKSEEIEAHIERPMTQPKGGLQSCSFYVPSPAEGNCHDPCLSCLL